MENYIAEHIHEFVTRDELLTLAGVMLGVLTLIWGIMSKIMYGSIKAMILETELKIMNDTKSLIGMEQSKREEKEDEIRAESKEIRTNYIDRFEQQSKMLSDLRVLVTEIKKDIDYIKNYIKQ